MEKRLSKSNAVAIGITPKRALLSFGKVQGESSKVLVGSIPDSKFFNGSHDNVEAILDEFEKNLKEAA